MLEDITPDLHALKKEERASADKPELLEAVRGVEMAMQGPRGLLQPAGCLYHPPQNRIQSNL